MTVSELLMTLRDKGIVLEARGDKLRYYPASAVGSELREALASHKAEVLAILDNSEEEIAWRVEAMLPQIPDTGPIPFLVAREAVEPGPDGCHSCGDTLAVGDGYVCGPCSRAANRALEVTMSRR